MKWTAIATSVVLGLILPIANLPISRATEVALAEKSDTTPTEFWWLQGAPESQVKDKITDGYRILDLEVEQTSPYRFSAAMVKNQGIHAKSWWWYYGLTSEQVKAKLDQHKARIIDLQVNHENGQKRYADVLVANTGDQAKSWW